MTDESLRIDETFRKIADSIIAFLFLKMPVFSTHMFRLIKKGYSSPSCDFDVSMTVLI